MNSALISSSRGEKQCACCVEKEGKMINQTARSLMNHYLKPYRRKQRVLLLTAFLQILCSIGVAVSLKTIIDQALIQKNKGMLMVSCCTFLLSALAQVFFSVRKQKQASGISEEAMARLRTDLLDHYLSLPLSDQSKIDSSQLLTHCMQDVESVREMLSTRQVRRITDALTVAVLTVFLAGMDWHLALLVAVCLPLFLIPAAALSHSVPRAEKNVKEKNEELNKIILQSADGAGVIRHLGAEKDMGSRFADKAGLFGTAVYRKRIVGSLREVSGNFLSVAMTGLFMVLGGWLYLKYRTCSAGVFFSFMTLIPILYGAAADAVSLYLEDKGSEINLNRIESILGKPAERYGVLSAPAGPAEIRFEHVDYAYGDNRVLSDVSMMIRPGQKVAVIGASGSGKSTFAGLLAGLLKPDRGEILFNGHRHEDYSEQAGTELITMMEQFPIFWGSTVEEIICGNGPVDEERMKKTAAAAGFDEDAMSLPEKYKTRLGEKTELSGGQQQRLALAALLYHNPGIMILDEPTSALSRESEEDLWRLFRGSLAEKTVIVLTHSMSLAAGADLVLRIENGRIKEVIR